MTQDRAQDLRLAEALLFAAAEPLDEAALAQRLSEGCEVRAVLAELAGCYEGRGVNLVRVAGGWVFRTAPDLGSRLDLERRVTRKLSRAAVETLAIIAYHQPVTRGEVEEIRGVGLGRGVLDTLVEAGWIRPKGHKPSPGRPAMWVTTPQFLEHFGLDALSDLPGVEELRATGLLDSRPAGRIGETAEPEPAPAEGGDEADAEP